MDTPLGCGHYICSKNASRVKWVELPCLYDFLDDIIEYIPTFLRKWPLESARYIGLCDHHGYAFLKDFPGVKLQEAVKDMGKDPKLREQYTMMDRSFFVATSRKGSLAYRCAKAAMQCGIDEGRVVVCGESWMDSYARIEEPDE